MAKTNQDLLISLVTGLDYNGQNLSQEEQINNLSELLNRLTDFESIEEVIFYKNLLFKELEAMKK